MTNLVSLKNERRMKKIIVLFLLPLICIGQEKEFELGVLFGASYNSLPNNSVFNEENKRPIGGVLTQYNFNKSLSIKTKILYHLKGGSSQNNQVRNAAADRAHLELHYLTMPMLLQINFGKNRIKFFINSGGYLGWLIKERAVNKKETYLTEKVKEVQKNKDGKTIILYTNDTKEQS